MRLRAGIYCRFGSEKQFEGWKEKIPQFIELGYDKENNSCDECNENSIEE